MRQREANANTLRRRGQGGLLVILMAVCLLAVGSPVQADPPGSQYDIPFLGGTVLTDGGDSLVLSIVGIPVFNLGNSKSIDATGTFTMTVDGNTVAGTWEGTKLDSFHSFGRCVDSQFCLDTVFDVFGADGTTWEAGRVRAKIVLKDLGGNVVARGRLTVTCSLPGFFATPVRDYDGDGDREPPEGFKVDIGSLHFGDGGGVQRSLTLFTRLAD